LPSRPPAERSLYKFRPLAEGDRTELEAFACGDEDLDDFIRTDALRYQAHRTAQTYLAHHDARLVGYVALMADAVILTSGERRKLKAPSVEGLGHQDPEYVPAVKVARLAVCATFRESNSGTGTELVRIACLLALQASRSIGCRLLTVDAYAEAVGFYEGLGFVHNSAKQYRERDRPSMRLDLFANEVQSWIFE